MIVFEIKGQPMGKQRPKFARTGGFVRTYTPKKTKDYEQRVKDAYEEQCIGNYEEEPISILIKAYFEIPKSYSFKKRFACVKGEIRPTTKPDNDNIAKVICDSLNGIAYKDDKQIVDLYVEKYYSMEPRVRVIILGGDELAKADKENQEQD